MSGAMEWSQDFCLSCDNVNPTEGPYCSEACRLLDLDKSTESAHSHTAVYSQSYAATSPSWSLSHSNNRSSGMYLPPAVNFSALRTGTVSLPNSPRSPTTGSYFNANHSSPTSAGTRHHHSHHHAHSNSRRSLTTSSSRSSLSSISTSTTSHGLSDQAITQLRNYVNSFDHTRELKRRQTLA